MAGPGGKGFNTLMEWSRGSEIDGRVPTPPQTVSPADERDPVPGSVTPPTTATLPREQAYRRGRFAVFPFDSQKRRNDDDETLSDYIGKDERGEGESTTPDSASHQGSAAPVEERSGISEMGLNLVYVHDFLDAREQAFHELFEGIGRRCVASLRRARRRSLWPP